ncbi:hypothetical protein L9F63_009907, partial [Diploptera punctata]
NKLLIYNIELCSLSLEDFRDTRKKSGDILNVRNNIRILLPFRSRCNQPCLYR